MSSSTKSASADTGVVKPGTKRTGRPRLGDTPLTAAERSRRARARRAKPVVEQMKGVTKASVLADLIRERQLTTPLHKAVAAKFADAFVANDPIAAGKWLDLLPPVRSAPTSPGHSTSSARQRLFQLVMNARAADLHELAARAERGEELSEADRLRLRLAQLEQLAPTAELEDHPAAQSGALAEALARIEQLEDEARHLRGTKPRRLPPPSEKPLKPVTKSARAESAKPAADPAPKQPANWDACVNGLWRPPTAAPAATARPVSPPPSSSPPPPSSSPPPQSWDESPGGVAWNTWRNSGGYGSGGEPAQGWIDKLNGR
jgi:hypothetical protein